MTWLRSSSISLDGYGSKIQRVSRYKPAVSNKTILATRYKFFFTKAAPVQSITDTVFLDFWLMLLSWMSISSYTTIYFFECLYCSEYDIRMFLYVYWLKKRPSIKYVCNWFEDGGSHPKCYISYQNALPHISSL